MSHDFYPASPKINDYSFLDPKPSFAKQAWSVVAAILLFGAVYLLLIAGALALVYYCVLAAIGILSAVIGVIPLALAAGLICLSLMIFAFLFKFIFVVNKFDTSGSLEIKRSEHPRLFAFIDQLTDELKAPKPKKIYLLPEVNASVFYNSSFWSMFFPVRKNLNIGLGLVNCLNMSEFKSVLGHEFGHFSQRSMKLGSYVYTVNHVIHNLVYHYDRWDRTLEGWAGTGGIFGLFAQLTYWLAERVRQLLRFLYGIINKRNLSLSREMEYNADLVAVSAAGCSVMISGLRRVGFGMHAYQSAINGVSRMLDEQKVAKDFYEMHTSTLHDLAALNELAVEHGLPIISDEQMNRSMRPNRVVYKDQWASHPEQEDREKNIRTVDIEAETVYNSPWTLFENPEKLKIEMTKLLYRNIELPAETIEISNKELLELLKSDREKAKLPEQFNGFYDSRLLMRVDWQAAIGNCSRNPQFETIFSDENTERIKTYFANCQDRDTLELIKEGNIDVRTFEFDGKKYKKKQVVSVLKELNTEIETDKKWFEEIEANAFCFHYQKANSKSMAADLLIKYQTYNKLYLENEVYRELSNKANYFFSILQNNTQLSPGQSQWFLENVNNLRNEVHTAFSSTQTVEVLQPAGIYEPSIGWSTFLLPEEKPFFENKVKDGESFMAFFNGIQSISEKTSDTLLACQRELIWWQAEL